MISETFVNLELDIFDGLMVFCSIWTVGASNRVCYYFDQNMLAEKASSTQMYAKQMRRRSRDYYFYFYSPPQLLVVLLCTTPARNLYTECFNGQIMMFL